MRTRRAFTLIELLIVVAIIAILAAIAIPNLLNAQVRAKTSRAASDMRNISVGLESYVVDFNRLPRTSAWSSTLNRLPAGYRVLTTPIAYMGTSFSQFVDPFSKTDQATLNRVEVFYESVYGSLIGPQTGNRQNRALRDAYIIESVGPDTLDSIDTGRWGYETRGSNRPFRGYDPTNGTVSFGDLYRIGGRVPRWFMESGMKLLVPDGA